MKEEENAVQETAIEEKSDPLSLSFEEREFYNWCEANDVDYALEGADNDDRKGFQKIKKHFTDAIKENRLIVDGDKFTYIVSKNSPNAGEKFIVRRPNGRAMLAMDGYKESAQNQKLQSFMAAICGIEKRDIVKISALDNKDYKVLQDVALLFLTD
jgi:hypothetical protein